MTGIVALTFGGMITSCSHDVYEGSAGTIKNIQNNYESAFIQTFGEPAPTQDWGFGPSTVAGTRGMTRALGDYDDYKGSLFPVESYQDPNDGWKWKTRPLPFPSDCDASNFDPDLTDILSYDDYCKTLGNANWTPDEFAYGEVYIDKVQKIHIWGEYGKRAKLYIKEGTYDFTNETFDLCADADLYLLSGATVTLSDAAASTAKFDIYIAPGATLIANGENGFRADVDAHIYNHGTIECTRFEVNGTSTLYNVGTLTSSGDVYIANSTSRIVNDGTINAASTHVEGSGALQNNAEWTVTGNTIVNCNVGGWVNNGHWTTQNYYYTAGSNNVINNCFLKVTEDFNINMSSASTDNGFRIDSNGGVLTKNFYGGKAGDNPNSISGPYKVIMGHKSLFKVTGTATLEGGNKGWGFYGPADGEYAVFQAKDIVRNPSLVGTQGAVTYGGNLYVSAETHFAQGHDGQDSDGHYFISEVDGFSVKNIYAPGFQSGTPDITINTTPCNPGFNVSGDDGGGADEIETIRVIAEDLTTSDFGKDFDFNDAVFDVIWNKTQNKVSIKILAAGGELSMWIGGTKDGANRPSVNEYFALANKDKNITEKTMINTAPGLHNEYNPYEYELNANEWSGTTIGAIANSIYIRVMKSGETITLSADQGKAASKIAVGTDYDDWCDEREDVDDKFGGKFSKYVRKEDGLTWNTWYKNNQTNE